MKTLSHIRLTCRHTRYEYSNIKGSCHMVFAWLVCILVLSSAATVANAATRLQPWEEWLRNPIAIPVTTTMSNINCGSSSSVTITLSDGCVTQVINSAGDITNAPPFLANLKVRREYLLTVTSSGLVSADLDLSYQANWAPLHKSGQAAKPKEYHLLVDRGLDSDHLISLEGNGGPYSNVWVIELCEQLPAQWRLEDGSDDPKPAPGDGVWAQIGPGKSLETNRAAISWSVGLGRLMDGLAAGRLTLRETGLSRDVYTPKSLYYTAGSAVVRYEVNLIPETPGSLVLRQVKAYQSFVDIVTISTNETELRFYLPQQIGTETNALGHYTNFWGDPFVVWELANPQPSTTNQLHIVEQRNGLNRTNEVVFQHSSSNGVWSLSFGSGTEKRIESRTVVFSAGTTTNRIETVDIRYAGASVAAYRAQETYRRFPWGFDLVETRIDPDGNQGTSNDLVTSFTFNDDIGDTNSPSYGKPIAIINPDGSWEKRLYAFEDVWPLAVLTPFGDAPESPSQATPSNSVVTLYDPNMAAISYAPPWLGIGYENKPFRSQSNFNDDGSGLYVWSTVGENTTFGLGIFDPYAFVGAHTSTWGEEAEFGRYKHPITKVSSSGPSEIWYYNSVTYNPTNRTYVIDTNQPAWAGPDWRSATVFNVHDSAASYGFPDENGDFVQARWADGQELFDPVDFGWNVPWLVTNQSYRDSEVYHQGSLAIRDRSVFLGASDYVAEFDLISKWVYQNDSLGHATNVMWIDGATGISRGVYSADYRGTNAFDGELVLSETDESGVKTIYAYDSLKRLRSRQKEGISASGGFPAQSAITTSFGYDARSQAIGETNTAGNLTIYGYKSFDLANRLTMMRETNGLVTSLSYELDGRRTIEILPSGLTRIQEKYLDGRMKSVTGTAVVHEFHEWDYVGGSEDPYLSWLGMMDTVRIGSTNSARVVWQAYDWPGRLVLDRKPAWQSTNYMNNYRSYYGERSSLLFGVFKTTGYSSEGFEQVAVKLFNYDLVGTATNATLNYTESGPNLWPTYFNVIFSEGNSDRLTRLAHRFSKMDGHWFACTTNMQFRQMSSSTPTFTQIIHERLNGFSSSNVFSDVKSWDVDTNLSVATVTLDRSAKKIIEVADKAQSTLNATNIIINGLLQLQSTPTVSAGTRVYYDALGRQTQVVSPLGFTAAVYYNQYGQVTNQTDFTGNSTSIEYYSTGETGAGQIKRQTQGGKNSCFSYTSRGELYRTWGNVPYPEERVYSDFGELVQLRTFRLGTGWQSGSWPTNTTGGYDTTTWTFDDASGALAAKSDAQSQSITYAYPEGMYWTRTWARTDGTNTVTLTNTYNGFGEISHMVYSDDTPSVEFNDFNRIGQPETVVDATGTSHFAYDHASRLISIAYEGGLLDSITVSNHFDGLNGRDALSALSSSTPLVQHISAYDSYGRMGSVANSAFSASYAYKPNSDLLQTTTCKSNTTTILTTSRSWEYGSRLSAIVNEVNGVNISSHSYTYDALNRRTWAAMEDGSAWQYAYNDRNELTDARRYWLDAQPVAGQQFGYAYDNIGNRQTSSSGGDVSGMSLRSVSYTANSLNQYTSILTPGYKDIIGAALATNSVTVNGGTADRKVEYYHREISVANSSGPLWQLVTNASGGVSITNGCVFPKNQQSLTYDLDGNLTFDGVWSYEWDGENRLKAMTMTNVAGIANSNRLRLDFAYDYMNRRVQKTVCAWNGSAFVAQSTNRFVYDGWNLIAILDPQSSVIQSFTWGQDLSGTMTKAGGVGGLLIATISGTNTFAAYDGNGNITALISATDKTTSARYEYNPFGELIRVTGLLAVQNPFRFSTKFWEQESGLVYYGWRYFSPVQGKWIGRDPTTDQVFLNLYVFCNNNPLNAVDRDGRDFSYTGLMTTMAIGGMLGGAYNSAVMGGSFVEGFIVGAIGAATGYTGAILFESAVVGGALAGGASYSANSMTTGHFNTGSLVISMLSGAGVGWMGDKIATSLIRLNAGAMRDVVRERLEEIGLDAVLAVAANVGVGAAIAFENGWEAAVDKLGW